MSAGLDACVAHSASAHRDRLACTRRIQPPDSTTTYAAAGRGRLRWPAARSTPARCSLAQLSGSHCERGRWSTLTRRRSSRLWLTQAGVRFFSRRGCSIPPRAICSLDARQQPARLLLHLAAADLTGHGLRAATLLTFWRGATRRAYDSDAARRSGACDGSISASLAAVLPLAASLGFTGMGTPHHKSALLPVSSNH